MGVEGRGAPRWKALVMTIPTSSGSFLYDLGGRTYGRFRRRDGFENQCSPRPLLGVVGRRPFFCLKGPFVLTTPTKCGRRSAKGVAATALQSCPWATLHQNCTSHFVGYIAKKWGEQRPDPFSQGGHISALGPPRNLGIAPKGVLLGGHQLAIYDPRA